MAEMLLTVPAEHREAFRHAALYEVGFSGEMVTGECKGLAEGNPQYPATRLIDLNNNAERLDAELALVAQVGLEDGPVQVRADLEVLMGVTEEMARLTGKRLSEELQTAPVEPAYTQAIRESLDWALAQVEHLTDRWNAEREAVAA